MQITFDPHNPADVKAVMQFFGDSAASTEIETVDEVVPAEDDPRGGVELDANGTPWIDGIHATTRSKKSDGTWTKRRGAPEDEVAKAEAEARAKLAGTPEPAEDLPEVVAPEPETKRVTTIEELTTTYAEAAAAGVIDADGMMELYKEFGVEPKEVGTNETARAGLVVRLRSMIDNPPKKSGLPGLPG